MKLVKRLQECTSLAQADQILSKYTGIRPTFRKTLETAMLLKNNADPTQRDIGQQFFKTVLQEASDMEKSEEPASPHDKGIKSKDDGFIKEETLDNHNPENQDKGGQQSSDNVEPYPQVADDSDDGSKDMEKMDDTENQMKEAFPPSGGMPPQGGMPPMGLEPNVANKMGAQMPQLPPMNTNQMMRQMQYTLNETLKRYIVPMNNRLRVLQEAIKKLSYQIREVEAGKGSMKLDIAKVRANAPARVIRETSHGTVMTTPDGQLPLIHSRVQETESAQFEINQLDKMFRSKAKAL